MAKKKVPPLLHQPYLVYLSTFAALNYSPPLLFPDESQPRKRSEGLLEKEGCSSSSSWKKQRWGNINSGYNSVKLLSLIWPS